jgi:GrpB-like predicted nucleotidyltransferase (UPF0157 family)
METAVIGPYPRLPTACDPPDSRAATVAPRVAGWITARVPAVAVEHIGSTAVPGCAGKGVVDLMVVCPEGQLDAAKQALDALGFQRQTSREPWPEERPMRIGALEHDGQVFRLHVHVIPADSPEVVTQRAFRDRLRADPALVAAYVARKREILAAGLTDGLDYSHAKDGFIRAVLADA